MADWYENNAQKKTSLLPEESREAYEKKLMDRQEASAEPEVPLGAQPQAQPGQQQGNGIGQGAIVAAQQAGAQGFQTQNKSQIDTLGNAGLASGNPYLMAIGAGMKVYAAGEQKKRAQEEQKRVEYNERIMERQKNMQLIASQGIQ